MIRLVIKCQLFSCSPSFFHSFTLSLFLGNIIICLSHKPCCVHILVSFRKLVCFVLCMSTFICEYDAQVHVHLFKKSSRKACEWLWKSYIFYTCARCVRWRNVQNKEGEREKPNASLPPFRRTWFDCACVEAMCVRMWYRWQHRLTFHVYIISLIALNLFYAVALCSKRVYDHASLDVCCSSVASNNLIQ